jgi:hypothetical protein
MRMLLRIVLVASALLTAAEATAQSTNPSPAVAGRVKTVAGDAVIVRGTATVPVQVGVDVFESDRLRTGSNGRVGLTLQDDTRVSVGPKSEVSLEAFRYAPAEGSMALAIKFVQGVAVYVSGKIAKLAPDAVRLETPAAIVGVRGTTVAIKVAES